MLSMNTGNRVHPVAERGRELHETPPVAVRVLARKRKLSNLILEPACGPGNIVRELRGRGHLVVAADIEPTAYDCPQSTGGINFLDLREAPPGCTEIVTNPPYSLDEKFLAHALDLCPKVYLLMRTSFINGVRWIGRGKRFGRHLKSVIVFVPRLPMMHREGYEGEKNENSGMDFSWFCFERDCRPRARGASVEWVDWRPYATKAELVEFAALKAETNKRTRDRRAAKKATELAPASKGLRIVA
jgi:hypothetical protein